MKKTAKKEIVIHGTSTKYLREILKKGLIPDPKQKQFQNLPGVYGNFFGVYLGKDIPLAYHYASNAVGNRGGSPMFVVAQVETKTPSISIDEEEFLEILESHATRPSYVILRKFVASLFDHDIYNVPKKVVESLENYIPLVDNAKEIILRLEEGEYYTKTSPQLKTELRVILKKITKKLKFVKDQMLETGHGVVVHEPINFKGVNKIESIFCLVTIDKNDLRDLRPSVNKDDSKEATLLFEQNLVSFINSKIGASVLKSFKSGVFKEAVTFAIPLYGKNKTITLKVIQKFIQDLRGVEGLSEIVYLDLSST